MKAVALGLVVVTLLAFGVWSWFAGPCWLYSYSSVKDVPARCLMR